MRNITVIRVYEDEKYNGIDDDYTSIVTTIVVQSDNLSIWELNEIAKSYSGSSEYVTRKYRGFTFEKATVHLDGSSIISVDNI